MSKPRHKPLDEQACNRASCHDTCSRTIHVFTPIHSRMCAFSHRPESFKDLLSMRAQYPQGYGGEKTEPLLSRSFQTCLHPTPTHPASTPLCGKGPLGGKPGLNSEFLETKGPCMSSSQGVPGSDLHLCLASEPLECNITMGVFQIPSSRLLLL